jgi:hypothetical protein
MLILAVIGFIGDGLAWLYMHELPYLILGVVVVLLAIVFLLYSMYVASTYDEKQLGKQIAQARVAEAALRQATATLKREAESLERLRVEVSGQANFELLRQRHYKSMRIADQWYAHTKNARTVRRAVNDGLRKIQGHGTRDVVIAVRTALTSLDREIARGRQGIDEYNIQTGKLRDHIHSACGEKGRLWYERLEARKQERKIIDN